MGAKAIFSDTGYVTPMPYHPETCAGCLGNAKCWVCLGTGYLGPDRDATCHRCEGTGRCAEGTAARTVDVAMEVPRQSRRRLVRFPFRMPATDVIAS
ncbi:MAG: hypothetical protein QOD07_2689 [Frankiaceae bacterium]|jgi:hypothetical protein|nr:hypothetical protein [Frankiaceae bacterium]